MANRLFVFEPNPENNRIIPNEDLNIIVELNTTKRARNAILVDGNGTGQLSSSNSSKPRPIKFIAGSNYGNQTALTTNWSTATSKFKSDANNPDDLETLGIESISIDFDTAYTPVIKIKFIDVRGTAIFSQGNGKSNNSKYNVFFELPYPIFELKVKGYFGRAVKYCLHLVRWNSNFNSDTGNFEINAEFIGYTYAALTDMLMGYIRAVIKTTTGAAVWEELKIQYAAKGVQLKSIEEFLKDVQTLSDVFAKVKNDDSNVKELEDNVYIKEVIESLKLRLNEIGNTIVPKNTGSSYSYEYFNDGGMVLGCTKTQSYTKVVTEKLKNQTESIKTSIKTANEKITNADLHIDADKVTKFIRIDNIKGSEVADTEETIAKRIYYNNSNDYALITNTNASESELKKVKDLAKIIKKNNTGQIPNDALLTIFDLREAYGELDNILSKSEKNDKDLREKLGNDLAAKAKETLGFDTTIRNIFTIFTAHCEALMLTIQRVSFEAEKSTSRKDIMNQIITNKTGNIKDGSEIYPWIEYREVKNNDGYVESWLGSNQIVKNGDNLSKIPELVFVEEMLKALTEIVKSDEEIIENNEQNLGVRYYPISPLDSPITSSLIKKNPYDEALNGENSKCLAEEATRCLLMRGFLGLGVSNKNTKIRDIMAKTYGTLEAENLFEVVKKFDTVKASEIANQIYQYGNGNASAGRQKLLSDWEEGYSNITNPTGSKKRLLKKTSDGKDYIYSYISDGTRSYIPINTGFDGLSFYGSDKKLKSNDEISFNAETIHFTSNVIGDIKNAIGTIKNGAWEPNEPEDGSVMFKIIPKSTYESSVNNPEYGSDVLETYRTLIPEGTVIRQNTLKKATYEKDGTIGSTNSENYLDFIGGTYKTLEIKDIKYDAGDSKDDDGEKLNYNGADQVASVLCAYWSQADREWNEETKGGNYLCRGIDVKNLKSLDYSMINDDGTLKTTFNELTSNRNYNRKDLVNKLKDYGKQREILGDLLGETNKNANDAFVPFIEFSVTGEKEDYSYFSYSLFGSPWYYAQETNEAKALLFLHTFGWQGLIGDIRDVAGVKYNTRDVSLFDRTFLDKDSNSQALKNTLSYNSTSNGNGFLDDDDTYTIKGLFMNNGSFIKAPKLWIAFIGGILYRYDSWRKSGKSKDIIKFKMSGVNLLPWAHSGSYYPTPQQYLYDCRAQSNHGINLVLDSVNKKEDKTSKVRYATIDNTITDLPRQVREEFKNAFLEFVKNDFANLQSELEIFDEKLTSSNYSKWKTNWSTINNSVKKSNTSIIQKLDGIGTNSTLPINTQISSYIYYYSTDGIKNALGNTNAFKNNSYMNISTPRGNSLYQYTLMINPYSNATNLLRNMISSYDYIMNGSPRVFDGSIKNTSTTNYANIVVKGNHMNIYLDSFFERWANLIKKLEENRASEQDELQQKIFNTIDDDSIKLNIYRTMASIYNKWVAGVSKPFKQCGSSSKSNDDSNLIDSFRFVDRAYLDIGDKFYLNPIVVSDLILGNLNQSFFDIANRILSDNNFNFIPLPTFINYNDINDVADVFKPYTYLESKNSTDSGPAFVCCYVGQGSTSLDLGEDAMFPDDGIQATLDSNGNLIGLPDDFSSGTADGKTLNIPFFLVSYARQNQSYFKNLKLDQTEFTETEESLHIFEDLSNSGDKRKANYSGQNLWNVYQTRAYSAEVEMMGNAMIQPMMYFQLDDIPMFRGAYNIIKVSHTITPHNMVTNFKGSRVKRTKSPLIDVATLFMSLLGSLEGGVGDTRSVGAGVTGVVYTRTGSPATQQAIAAANKISCGIVKKETTDFESVLKLVINNLEGSWCAGGYACGDPKTGPEKSGETLWGLDRKNHGTNAQKVLVKPLDIEFWNFVDNNRNKPKAWSSKYPKPDDVPDVYNVYKKVIKNDYDSFIKNIKTPELKKLIESDGRLYFNMIYAVYNGAGWFKGYAKLLEIEYANGKRTADELLKVFVNERVTGSYNAFRLGTGNSLGTNSATLKANTGVKIERMVGIASTC